ncbi:unnamed protein product [Caenorhabditis angaria]|uniref:RING-type domain-containing protein n=1 Tax=Caenorhabditis angaria TaxID=860376 RepID=A0A9P1J0Z7_9PELO|nr:unnamed protein product [Caenorhabditis angaria]
MDNHNQYPHHPCPVCEKHLDHRSNEIVKPLLCMHHFHKKCILKKCKESGRARQIARCPVCNRALYKFIVLAKNENGEKNFKFVNTNGRNVQSRYQMKENVCKYCFIGNLFDNQLCCSKCDAIWHKFCGPETTATTETGELLCNECDSSTNEQEPEEVAGPSNSQKQETPSSSQKKKACLETYIS